MARKQKQNTNNNNGNNGKCVHHWQIEPPEKHESEGECLKCGAKKKFLNNASVPYEQGLVFPSQTRSNTNPAR